MSLLLPYKRLNRFIRNETLEPTLNWGIRMGIASVVPIVWGVATGHLEAAKWMALTAECICWVELRGSTGLRLRVLTGGVLLALFFTLLGSVTGGSLWLSLLAMIFVGLLTSLFKNLGDRGSGLAICVFVLFIISNAYPVTDFSGLQQRMLYVFTGGMWNLAVGMIASAFIRAQEPYRRSIALIWKAISGLVASVAEGWDGKKPRNGLHDIYIREQLVRRAIDSSFQFYESSADQVTRPDTPEYPLAQTRKATALVATHVIAIGAELETVAIKSLDNNVRLKLYALFKAIQQMVDRMAVYILTLKPEEEILLHSRIRRLRKLAMMLRDYPQDAGSAHEIAVQRVVQLTERMIRLVEASMKRMQEIGTELPVYRSYSLIKTLYVLHPRYLIRNLRLLFSFNTFMVRYALRTALAATLALSIYKWLDIDRGYWLPLTVVIVIQPYFGATLRKAIDRIIGTVLGGFAGSLILLLPTGLFVQEIMLFFAAIFMVYYIRRKYSVAAFFITITLVLLFSVDQTFYPNLVWVRALSTLGGAALAVIAGFVLLPDWDSEWLPSYLAAAVSSNYIYMKATLFPDRQELTWTRYKRDAEIRNSNLFDSFLRYMREPAIRKKQFVLYYQIVTHNMRLTRELNNINIEEDSKNDEAIVPATPEVQQQRIMDAIQLFNQIMVEVHELAPQDPAGLIGAEEGTQVRPLTDSQMVYLDRMIIELNAMHYELERLNKPGNYRANDHSPLHS